MPFLFGLFWPLRANQLYCNYEHAYTFRNRLNKLRSKDQLERIKHQLSNLKLLASLEIDDMVKISQEELDSMGFDWKGTTNIVNPLLSQNPNSVSHWAEVYGFLIRKSENLKHPHWFFPPSFSKILLTNYSQ
jgi:hypothetical protein